MIQELREYSQSFLFKLLLGVICVTFVVSFGVGSFGDRKEVIAKVNGREILLKDYRKAYQNRLQSLRCLLYTSPSPRDLSTSRMPSSA